MSGRDLLYKPQITIIPDEDSKAKDLDPKAKTNASTKAQAPVAKGPRELGHVGKSVLEQLQRSGQSAGAAPKAFKHAYFNNDISGVREANFNRTDLKALRGSKEATNLRKVVLPSSGTVDHPEPAVLQGAFDLMGVAEGFTLDLGSLLGRQGAWAKSKTTTLEMIKERMARLESMVEARKAALGRMADGKSNRPITSVTLLQAATAAGSALDQVEDVGSAGTELIQRTAAQATGLHARLAKMFGVKLQ